MAILTDLNIAEICGLRWKRVNLIRAWSEIDRERIPPQSIAVREQWCFGKLSDLRSKARIRNVLIPEILVSMLLRLRRRQKFTAPEDYVLVSRLGGPIDESNIAARRLRPIGISLGMPWLSWQVFRRTRTGLIHESLVSSRLLDY